MGLMFAIVGILLVGYGLLGDKTIYKVSLGINVNLWWGLVMLAFGVLMLVLGRRNISAAIHPAEAAGGGGSPEKSSSANAKDYDRGRRKKRRGKR
jgi:hypothetical protein